MNIGKKYLNKRRVLLFAVLVIIASLFIGSTIAYFTTETRTRNVITTGSVDIELYEWADEEKTKPFPEEGVSGVMPGCSVTKIVEIENTGSADAFIRILVEKEILLADGQEGDVDLNLIELDIGENWTEQDGFYYYNEPLAPGEKTEPLFTGVRFAPGMGNLYQSSTATVTVQAQAVQVRNNPGETAMEAQGWPASEQGSSDDPEILPGGPEGDTFQ